MISIQEIWDNPSILDGKYLKFTRPKSCEYFSPTKFEEDTLTKDRYSKNPNFSPICAGTTDFKFVCGKALEIEISSEKVALYNPVLAGIFLSIYPDERGLICDVTIEEITKEEFDLILSDSIKKMTYDQRTT